MLPTSDETAFLPDSTGLVLLAVTETALERPARTLRELFGDRVNIGQVSVRYRRGKLTEESHMGIRVACAREHSDLIKADLERRGASIIDAEINRQVSVVRATAPLTL